jgi:crotonobetainyl-CoA:carnitine CoA-transferase CaiB-like acyl-CoA transferase
LTDGRRLKVLKVLEVGEGLSGAFAGLILAGLGHEVCQARTGLDRRLDPLESTFYDRGRVVLEPTAPWADLMPLADLVLVDLHPRRMEELGIPRTEAELAGVRPGLAAVAVTSLGLAGPHSHYEMDDITDWAAGGLAYATRRSVPADDHERYVPVLPPGRQPELLGGLVAAIASLAAARLARTTGRAALADVSRQEVIASLGHHHVPMLFNNLMLAGAPDRRVLFGWLVPAVGGDVYLRTVETSQWDRLVEWMGHPDWAVRQPDELPIYYTAPEVVGPLLAEWTRSQPQTWLLEEAARRRIPMAHPRQIVDVLQWPHLQERNTWEVVTAGQRSYTAPRIPLIGPLPDVPIAEAADVLDRWQSQSRARG